MNTLRLSIVIILLSVGFSCSNLTEKFSMMDELKEAISKKYDTENIEIKLNDENELTVLLKDPNFQDYSPSEKRSISHEIGKLAQELKSSNRNIEKGQVQFVSEKKHGMTKLSDSESYNMYN